MKNLIKALFFFIVLDSLLICGFVEVEVCANSRGTTLREVLIYGSYPYAQIVWFSVRL